MIPKYIEILLPLLNLLQDERVYTSKEYISHLEKEFNLSEEDKKQVISNGKTKLFSNRIAWAKTYLKQAGLVEYPKRGEVKITSEGLAFLKSKSSKITLEDLERYPQFVEFKNRSKSLQKYIQNGNNDENVESKTPEENLEDAFLKLKLNLADEILDKINTCSFDFFERMVIDLLIKMGYGGSREEAGRATKKTGDGGIDGIINQDRLGLDMIYIQAKRWTDTVVGRPEIQKFSGALDTPGANKGIFITTSTFTKEAKEYSKNINNKKIILIDGQQLAEYMIEFNVGVSLEKSYEVKRIDNDYFEEN